MWAKTFQSPTFHLWSLDQEKYQKQFIEMEAISFCLKHIFADAMIALNVYESKYYAGLKNVSRELTLDEIMIRFQGRSKQLFKKELKYILMGMKIITITDPHDFLINFFLE